LLMSAGMPDFSCPHVQAAEVGSECYQTDAILAVAEVTVALNLDMQVTYVEKCLQVALSLLKRDHDDDATPAALYLVATIFRAGPAESSVGRLFVQGGGDKLLLKFLALSNATRNDAVYVILAIALRGSELETVKHAVIKESSQSLAELYATYPPRIVDDDSLDEKSVVTPEYLSKCYQRIHDSMPDSWTSKTLSKYLL
jgi:hypothetical protein